MAINAQLPPDPIKQFFDANGIPLAGGKLFSYDAGTTTPKATFTDASGSVDNPNPIVLDSEGRCQFWIDNSGYKLNLKDASNVDQWTVDDVYVIPPGFVGTVELADGSVTAAKIGAAAVTTAKIGDQQVTTAKIADGAVTPAKIPDDSIEIGKIDPNLDVSGFNKNLEVALKGPQGILPQFPWTNPVLCPAPDVFPAANATQICWSPDEQFLAAANLQASPWFNVWQRFGQSFYNLTAANYVDVLPPSGSRGCAFSDDGNFLAVASNTTPFITVYQRFGMNFKKLANPATLPTAIMTTAAWSKQGQYLAIGTSASPFVFVYQKGQGFSGVTVGSGANIPVTIIPGNTTLTKLANPGTLPPGTVNDVCFSPDGQYLVVTSTLSPFFRMYQITPTNGGTLSLVATPAASGAVTGCAFSPDGSMLTLGLSGGSFIQNYSFSGGVLTALPAPASLPVGAIGAGCVSWSPNGLYVALGGIGSAGANQLIIYKRSGTTLTPIALPVSAPGGQITGVAWSPTGQFLAIALITTSPYVKVYQTSSIVVPADSVTWVRDYATS